MNLTAAAARLNPVFYRIRFFSAASTLSTRLNLTKKELSIALLAKSHFEVRDQLESRIPIIRHLSSTKHISSEKNLQKSPLSKIIQQHYEEYKDRLESPRSIPIFLLTETNENRSFTFTGTLGKIISNAARNHIIRGEYFFFKDLYDVKVSPNCTRTMDAIIGLSPHYFLNLSIRYDVYRDFTNTLLLHAVKRAVSSQGISPEAVYSDIKVYRFNEQKMGTASDLYTPIGNLTTLPKYAFKHILDGNFTLLPHFSREITHLSNHEYKDVSALVVGVRHLDSRELRNREKPGTYKNGGLSFASFKKPLLDKQSVESFPKTEEDPPRLKLTKGELTKALLVECPSKGSPRINNVLIRLQVLATLSAGKYALKNNHLKELEFEKAKRLSLEEYMELTIKEHCDHYPDEIPVFSWFESGRETIKFIYGGPLSALFDSKAHESLLEWNYEHYYQFIDAYPPSSKGKLQLDAIVIDPFNPGRGGFYLGEPGGIGSLLFSGGFPMPANTYIISKLIKRKIEEAAISGIKMGDLYSDTPLYQFNENETSDDKNKRYQFIQYLGEKPLSDSARQAIHNKNYTILTNCCWDTTPLSSQKLKCISPVILGTKNATPDDVFNFNYGY